MNTEKYISREMQFILSCIRHFILAGENTNTAGFPAGTFPKENLDWKKVLEYAFQHRVIALVQLALPRFDIDYPKFFLEQLKSLHENIARKSLLQTAELQRLTAAFQRNGIDFIVLKSVPLAQELYGSIANRTSHDIDLLVHAGAVESAFSCMHELGYATKIEKDALLKKNLMTWFRRLSRKDICFVSNNKRVQVELHWRVTDTPGCFPVPEKKLLAHKRTVKVAGTDIPVVHREEMVLYLCFHGAMHGWFRLHWLCDIALLYRLPGIDWEWIVAEAKRLGLTLPLGMAAVLIRDLFQTPIPPALTENKALIDAGLKIMPKVLPQILKEHTGDKEHFIHSILWDVRVQSGWHYRIAILLRLLCPNDGDREFFKLPDSLAGFYLILHPLRVVYQLITNIQR